jgi:polyhydroxyalkanoate synthesis regulator phasin
MLEMFKKSMLTGLGLAILTKEKVEELGRDMLKQAEVSESEGKDFLDDLRKRSEDARKDFESRVNQVTRDVVGRMNLATREEIAELNAKIDRLEAALREKS